jgi:hypothetical protein
MRNSISKTVVAGLAALTLSAAVVLPTSPASAAWGWHGGGWGGGWRGGGWNGGWRGAGWNGGWGGWRGGWGGGWGGWRGGWGGGCWGCGWGWGVGLGALATYPYWGGYYGYPYYGYGYGYGAPYYGNVNYGYGGGCRRLRPVYSRTGAYLGRRWVSVC